jgi:predicted nucleic acid-binding protein
MIFVDSTIPMYLVGEPHPHKFDTQRMLERAVSANERLVTDAEVLQEILHRYTAIDRRDAIHGAVMQRHGISTIMTFDRGFAALPGISSLAG